MQQQVVTVRLQIFSSSILLCFPKLSRIQADTKKSIWDKNHNEGKELNHTYFTFLLWKEISSRYAFQSDKSPFEIENIIIVFSLEYSWDSRILSLRNSQFPVGSIIQVFPLLPD
ncbi:hypothetical protein YC2023_058702 [Brassica napus]